jgi:hypothetical protein
MTTPTNDLRAALAKLTNEMESAGLTGRFLATDLRALLDAHPTPETDENEERIEAAYAWSDYRRAYGASGAAEHRAFMAGRASVLGRPDGEGALR